jgi:probable F420-dependent oxidoreductase
VPPTPFRFGAAAFSASSGAQWADRARQIEDLGYSTLVIGDHVGSGMLGPFSALAAAAAVTTTLHVGTTTFANDFRHPAVLAKEAATLDLLSDGRFELGLGAGWAKRQYDLAGFAFDPAGTRVTRLNEPVQVIQRLWSARRWFSRGSTTIWTDCSSTPDPTDLSSCSSAGAESASYPWRGNTRPQLAFWSARCLMAVDLTPVPKPWRRWPPRSPG